MARNLYHPGSKARALPTLLGTWGAAPSQDALVAWLVLGTARGGIQTVIFGWDATIAVESNKASADCRPVQLESRPGHRTPSSHRDFVACFFVAISHLQTPASHPESPASP